MTPEERIASLHMRMGALRERQEKQERQKTVALGSGCCGLALCLILLICAEGTGSAGRTAGLYSGATMLFENAGGYVAIAVAAFMAGVVIAVACIRHRQKQEEAARPGEIPQAGTQGNASPEKDSNGGKS